MLDLMSAFDALFQRQSNQPAVIAAVTVLANRSPPAPPYRIDPALQAVAPNLTTEERAAWIAVLVGPLHKAGIGTARCLAAFLGQCGVESAGFQTLEEDLGYSAARLCQVWPSRFPNTEAAESCALKPEILANRVYSNRMGNGDEASGDGWRFRGRGLIQITGRSVYTSFAKAMAMTLDQAVEHAASRAGAADSAAWFWTANQLNAPANAWSIDAISRKINGGNTGAAERARLSEAALRAIGA